MMRLLLRQGSLLCVWIVLLCGCTASVSRGWGPIGYWYIEDNKIIDGVQYSIRIDEEFNGAERQQLIAAIADWNYALNGQIKFKIVGFAYVGGLRNDDTIPTGGYWMIKTNSHNKTLIKLNTKRTDGATAVAYTNRVGGRLMYFNMEHIDLEDLKIFAYHEIGHALGASHDDEGLMKPIIDPMSGICIDRETMRQVALYKNLDWGHVNWCYFGHQVGQPFGIK